MPLGDLQLHINDLLYRFTNAALMDTCQRVGGDPARKLGHEDRLIRSAALALKNGICPAAIAVGTAAALCRYLDESDRTRTAENARDVLASISEIDPDGEHGKLILFVYEKICAGASVKELCGAADEVRHAAAVQVI